MNGSLLAAAFGVAFLSSLLTTPFIRKLSLRFGLVDRPDAHRKIHRGATPLGGGLAIILSIAIAGSLAFLIPSFTGRVIGNFPPKLYGVAVGVLFICCIGVWDDIRGMKARYKLIGQIVAAAIVSDSGLTIQKLSLLGQSLDLGILATPVTIFWLVLCMNALNLIDGADGLATTVGIVLCGTIAATAVELNNELVAFAAFALTGALLGFLRYNFPPASIFLGDAGSMSIGLLAGGLSVQSSIKGVTAFALIGPLAMWALPVMDLAMAVVRRKLTGRGLATTDRSHLHHCLLNRGVSQQQLLGIVGSLCAVCGFSAWLTVHFSNSWFALISIVALVVSLVSTRLFGFVEFQLASHHVKQLTRQFLSSTQKADFQSWQSKVRLQGVHPWEELWQFLVDEAESLELLQIKLDLNMPWQHEGYHAKWVRATPQRVEHLASLEWPLFLEQRYIGTLSLSGDGDSEQAIWMAKIAELLAEVQDRIQAIESRFEPQMISPGHSNTATPRVASGTPVDAA
ncbi:MAG: undecaprenyl/decaprenyl-phosphate alpha-N-acetylglucosaminyl 1-phosphate transferase [Planctomycetia bacterium]|nr:undecaprenyl/decaprenyl-phosphate alpha-N-acetylglucosaminyl 1-phosphate transferase [Planctomycetia bacterium]